MNLTSRGAIPLVTSIENAAWGGCTVEVGTGDGGTTVEVGVGDCGLAVGAGNGDGEGLTTMVVVGVLLEIPGWTDCGLAVGAGNGDGEGATMMVVVGVLLEIPGWSGGAVGDGAVSGTVVHPAANKATDAIAETTNKTCERYPCNILPDIADKVIDMRAGRFNCINMTLPHSTVFVCPMAGAAGIRHHNILFDGFNIQPLSPCDI